MKIKSFKIHRGTTITRFHLKDYTAKIQKFLISQQKNKLIIYYTPFSENQLQKHVCGQKA